MVGSAELVVPWASSHVSMAQAAVPPEAPHEQRYPQANRAPLRGLGPRHRSPALAHGRLTTIIIRSDIYSSATTSGGAEGLPPADEWRDGLIVTPGIVLYRSRERFPYRSLGEDRAFCSLSRSFQA